MSLYSIIDHRAPAFFPHKAELHMNTFPQFLFNFGLATTTLITISLWITLWWLVLIVLPALVAGGNWYFEKWTWDIPRTSSLDDHNIKGCIERMQRLYRNNPVAQEEISPILVSAYRCASKLDVEGVKEREALIWDYIKTMPVVIESRPVDYELEDFKMKLDVRKELQREGLL